ncbi:MAG: bacteriohopanetetrol glucosamine biosynthesis glycosyltransferase HpnI [Bryobacteraceae bacterium]
MFLLLVLVAGSWIYCVLTVVSAWRYRAVVPPAPHRFPPISVLKPLAGIDDGLEENLASVFKQDYPEFEILFAVRSAEDPAVPLVEKLRARYPVVASRLLVTGEPPYANAKVYSLDLMLAAACHDLIVMADSDVRFAPGMLTGIAAEFQDRKLGLATCPFRAVPGRSFWSRLEALGLNTDFLGGVLVARWLDGMKFAIGPTIAARRATLAAIGGFNAVKDYLAEDFVMGKLAAERGFGVLLSSHVIEHRIGSQPFLENLKHRMRWTRSTRRSRPRGYVGQVFTHPIPLALLLLAIEPSWWPLAAATCLLRAAAVWATGILVLRDPLTRSRWWLMPVADIASFLVWLAGFHGNTILWRGRKYYLLPDGRFVQEG